MLSISAVVFRFLVPSARTVTALQTNCYNTTSNNGSRLIQMVQEIIPVLSQTMYKGNCGRIGVTGGCQEYTGAPYFAGITSLKVGADLSHIFCTEGAATVIKTYSPELIVHPSLDRPTAAAEVYEWLPRLHSLVVGPGLGRDVKILDVAEGILEKAKSLGMPLVIDADGMFLLSQNPSAIKDYAKAILTPNAVEYSRLYEKVMGNKPSATADAADEVASLCRALGNVTIVRKGQKDIISNGKEVLICDAEGSPRRCGGQGDLLSGSMGVFTYWAHQAVNDTNNEMLKKYGATMSAAYAACLLTRECSRRAFRKHRRSMTTSDMIEEIMPAFESLYC